MKKISTQHGIATLFVVLIITFIVTIGLLGINKSNITEARSNNNYYYHNIATERAQAAISALVAELNDQNISKSYLNNAAKLKTANDCGDGAPAIGQFNCAENEKNLTLNAKFSLPMSSTLRATQLPDNGNIRGIRVWAIACTPDVNCATATNVDAKVQIFQDIFYENVGGGTGDWLSVNNNINRPWGASVEVRGLPFGTEGGMGFGDNNNTCETGSSWTGSTYTGCTPATANTGYFIRNADGSEGNRNPAIERGVKSGDDYFMQYFGESKVDFQNNSDAMSKVLWINGDATMTADGRIIGGGNTYTPGIDQMIIINGNLNMGEPWPGGSQITTGSSADPNNPAAFYWGLLYISGNANFGCNCNIGGRIAIEGDMNAYSSISIFPPSDGSNPSEIFRKMRITKKSGWRDF